MEVSRDSCARKLEDRYFPNLQTILQAPEREGVNDTIDSDTFKPTGKRLGMGCWGVVDKYKDLVGQDWAIKRFCPNEVAAEQMIERDWTEEHVMRAESLPLDVSKHHLVPRIIERDRKGKLYVGMPVYDDGKTLEDRKHSIIRRDDKDSVKTKLGIARDIAEALGYLHNRPKGYFSGIDRRNVAHGDVKPSNIFLVDGHAFLGDLGSSSCISISGHGSPRGQHGDAKYRAPECFDDDAEPSAKADVWSLGAITYELDTGRGIYEGIDVAKLSKEELGKQIKKKIKLTSRKIRPFLKKCLAIDESDRFYNGSCAENYLGKTLEEMNGWRAARKHFGWAAPAAGVVALIAGLTYLNATYEPTKLDAPTVEERGTTPGILYLNNEANPGKSGQMTFSSESITNLPNNLPARGMLTSGIERMSKRSTDNRGVAYLTKAMGYAQRSIDGRVPIVTEVQQNFYDSHVNPLERKRQESICGPVYPVIAKSIEHGIGRSITSDGKIDLEDVYAIARVGESVVNRAKILSGSKDFEVYRFAKDSEGKDLFSKKERDFLGLCINYAKNDVDLMTSPRDSHR